MPLTRRAMLGLMGASVAGAVTGCTGTITGLPIAGSAVGAADPGQGTAGQLQPPIVDGDPAPGSSGPQAKTIFLADDADLRAVNAADGSLLWQAKLTVNSTMRASAAADQDAVYCMDDDGYLSKWSTENGRQSARNRIGDEIPTSTAPLLLGGKVFFDNSYGDVAVLDADSLDVDSWTYHSGSSKAIQGSPIGTDGTVFFCSPTGYVIAFAADDGAQTWYTELPGAVDLIPAGELLLTIANSGMVALRRSDGEISWQQPDTDASLPTVGGDTCYATVAGQLRSFGVADGRQGWATSADESTDSLHGKPTVTGSVVCCLYQKYSYADSSAGIYSGLNSYLAGFDAHSGKMLWSNDSVFPSAEPVAVGGRIYVGANYTGGSGTQDALCCVDATTGRLIWKHDVPNNINAAPTIVTDSGTVTAYGGSF